MSEEHGRPSWSELLKRLLSEEFRRGVARFAFVLQALSHPAFWVLQEEQENPLWFLIDPLLDRYDDDDMGYRLVYVAARKEEDLVAAVTELLIGHGGAERIQASVRAVDPSVPGSTARLHTAHGLGHLAAREWHHAWPPFVIGLEGQVRAHAVANGAIDSEGRLSNGKQRPGVEGVAKRLDLAADFERFLLQRVYGGTGHLFRHGVAEEGVERQVVYMAVAVAGWLNVLGDPEPWTWLVNGLEASKGLHEALEAHAKEADAFVLDLMAKSLEGRSEEELKAIEELFRGFGEQ